MIKRIKKIKKHAELLQKSSCAYGTVEGDGKTCDCKFSRKGRIPHGDLEHNGCAEARKIIWLCNEVIAYEEE